MYDSDKFPWPLAGFAFARAWGLPYLAHLARWHNRDKADLALTLAPALSFLIRDSLIPADQALGLLRVVSPVEMWDWGWEHIIESLIEAKPKNLPLLLNEAFDQIEHAFPERPRASTLQDIRKVLERTPRAFAMVADRLARLEARACQPRKALSQSKASEYRSEFKHRDGSGAASKRQRAIMEASRETDPLSTESVESLVDKLDQIDAALEVKSRAFKALRAKVKYADQTKHIEAIVAARNIKLFAKIELLKAIRQQWLTSSPTQLAALKGVGVRLIRQHTAELFEKDWGFRSDLNGLADISRDTRPELALELIQAATTSDLAAKATAWLSLASVLSDRAGPDAPPRALQRLLDGGAARLADEVGDGAWRPELDSGHEPVAVTAGLVWFGLGSPEATSRWRAAHAVRALARLGCWPVIDKLFAHLEVPDAGPFRDQKLPFFSLHARQWFVLAIARLAVDYPEKVALHTRTLEAIAFDESYPHAGIREAARRAILSCAAPATDTVAKARIKRLRELHTSKFPRSSSKEPGSGKFSWDRPKSVPEPDPPFHFDYDFDKYQLERLARLFGLPRWQVADRCVKWIRKTDATIQAMHDFGGRPHPSGSYGYYHGTQESFHSYGTYLARHALALAGGELIMERPVVGDSYDAHPWEDWLSSYTPTRQDGLWLADGTRAYPDFALHELLITNAEKASAPTSDARVLSALAGVGKDRMIGEHLLVNAWWESPDRVSVSISSVLVPRSSSRLVARTVGTASPFDMWLPVLEEHEEENRRHFGRADMAPCEAWTTRREAEIKIDERDPYGSRAAVTRPRPSRHVIDAFKLQSRDTWSEHWVDAAGAPAFEAHAWGCRRGSGEREVWDTGTALACDKKFVSKLLAALDRDLLLLIKLQFYRERDRYDKEGSGGEFAHSYLVATIDRALNVRFARITAAHFSAVKRMQRSDRHEFQKRLRTLTRSAGSSRGKSVSGNKAVKRKRNR